METNNLTRRNFLKGLAAAGIWLSQSELLALAAQATGAKRVIGKDKVLVVVQLSGGNDGLNTVVPYGLGTYYDARPQIGIKPNEVIALNGQIGLNPNMSGMADLFKKGKLAIIQAVGYPNANRSHFRSIEIWQTASPDRIAGTGWLGRYLDQASLGGDLSKNLLAAVNVDPVLPKTLSANKVIVPSVANVNDFRFKVDPDYPQDRKAQVSAFEDIYANFTLRRPYVDLLRKVGLETNKASDHLLAITKNYKSAQNYPDNEFARGLKFISQMITGGVSSRIYNISLNGFDTHVNQARTQSRLLKQLSEGLTCFQADLDAHGCADDVLVMVFSEFGRRVSENNGRGTDHGTAEPLFVLGNAVHGGLYGDHPNLTNLDNGDLRHKIDFRSVYATILDRWLKADSAAILGNRFDQMGFV
ncbi:MAG: DUF1501 domain-containing protein [Candidatus Obscuribacterales bacterium]|nr:DUF1501 domain-containing protein [Candidatus Obscuribacterales bacterium]